MVKGTKLNIRQTCSSCSSELAHGVTKYWFHFMGAMQEVKLPIARVLQKLKQGGSSLANLIGQITIESCSCRIFHYSGVIIAIVDRVDTSITRDPQFEYQRQQKCDNWTDKTTRKEKEACLPKIKYLFFHYYSYYYSVIAT